MTSDLDHIEAETLPLRSLETLGVGGGFDRLYITDLHTGKQSQTPTNHDFTKYYRNSAQAAKLFQHLARPMVQNSGLHTGTGTADALEAYDGTNYEPTLLYAKVNSATTADGWTDGSAKSLALAYVQNGSHDSGSKKIGFYSRNQVSGIVPHLDFSEIEDVTSSVGMATCGHLTRYIHTSAWDFIMQNQDVIADLAKNIQYLDNGLFQLYSRDRTAEFGRVSDGETIRLALALSELGHTIRRGRFSTNVSNGTPATMTNVNMWNYTNTDGSISTKPINKGVINEFFLAIGDDVNEQFTLVAPWWLANKLDQYNFLDETRDDEMQRDVERKDLVEAIKLLFEAAEVERGLGYGSESTIPMLLFEKFKEGVLKDMTDFVSAESAVAAQFLGYNSPRDAYYLRSETGIGQLPYFPSLLSTHGTIIGAKKLEFTDRLAEHEKHTVTSPSTENFKKGMSYASSFEYNTMVTRTRFGDHKMDMHVYPFGFWRQVPVSQTSAPSISGTAVALATTSLVWFPIYSWSQFDRNVTTHGFFRLGANGATYNTSPSSIAQSGDVAVVDSNGVSDNVLWPENYWRPGYDNYFARVLEGTNELFAQWTERAENIRTEGAVGPTFGQINLMAEMTFDTPTALIARNFPFLRKMMTEAGIGTVIASSNASLDFMASGENMHNMAVWSNKGMFALEDRELFSQTAHPRDGSIGLELLPGVLPLAHAPDNWVSVFQARDALGFLTSLWSEPIMDAFTTSITATAGHNGYGTARLIVYQANKQLDGRVEDVKCTPMLGVAGTNAAGTVYSDHSAGTAISMFPSAHNVLNNYTVFKLGKLAIEGGTAVCARVTTGTLPLQIQGKTISPVLTDLTGVLEEDVIPGLYWQKLWLSEVPNTYASRTSTWKEHFVDVKSTNGTATQTANIAYLGAVSTLTDDNQHTDLYAWKDNHRKWIEVSRTDLEYQHASPSFFVFDKDCVDLNEAKFRARLYPLGKSTIGPITFVGGITSEGQAALTETITGEGVYTVIDLSAGAGASAMDSSDPASDDIATGEANPSMHIATTQEV